MRFKRVVRVPLFFGLVILLMGLTVSWFVVGALVAPRPQIVGRALADLPAHVIELASRSGSTRNRWILARLANRYDEWIMPNQQASEDKSDGFNLTKRAKSFYDAGRGLYRMFVSQHNAWIHAVATIAVVIMGLAMDVTRVDWCWLVLCIFGVWTAEALNTALECLADVASPEYHPMVRDAKDIAAGAVLMSAIGASIIGAMVFWPYWMA